MKKRTLRPATDIVSALEKLKKVVDAACVGSSDTSARMRMIMPEINTVLEHGTPWTLIVPYVRPILSQKDRTSKQERTAVLNAYYLSRNHLSKKSADPKRPAKTVTPPSDQPSTVEQQAQIISSEPSQESKLISTMADLTDAIRTLVALIGSQTPVSATA